MRYKATIVAFCAYKLHWSRSLHDNGPDTQGNKVITKQGHPPAWPLEPPDWSLTVCPVCGLRTPWTLRSFAAPSRPVRGLFLFWRFDSVLNFELNFEISDELKLYPRTFLPVYALNTRTLFVDFKLAVDSGDSPWGAYYGLPGYAWAQVWSDIT